MTPRYASADSERTRLRDQLGMDSMDFLDLVIELRKHCRIEGSKEDYPKPAILETCVEYLAPRLPGAAVS